MKIKQEHYKILKDGIENLGIDKIKLHKMDLPFSVRPPKDLDKRVRWDCLHATKIKIGDGIGQDGLPLYAYLDDSHIDTALRHIMTDLGI